MRLPAFVLVGIAAMATFVVLCSGSDVSPVMADISDSTDHGHPLSSDKGSGDGWVILNGELINKPYTFTIRGDTILINGVPAIYPLHRPGREGWTPSDVDSNAVARHELSETLWEKFNGWHSKNGFDAACVQAVEYLNSSPIVEHARIDSGGDIAIKYRGKPNEEYITFPTPDEIPDYDTTGTGPLRPNPSRLSRRVEVFEKRINLGSLIFIQNNRQYSVPPGRARALLNEISTIIQTTSNIEERIPALRKIIPSEDIATAVANNFINH